MKNQTQIELSMGTNDEIYEGKNLIFLIGIVGQILIIFAWIHFKYSIFLLFIQIFHLVFAFFIYGKYKLHIYKVMNHQILNVKIYWNQLNQFEEQMILEKHESLHITSNFFESIKNFFNENDGKSRFFEKNYIEYINSKIFNRELSLLKIYKLKLLSSILLEIKGLLTKQTSKIEFNKIILISHKKPLFFLDYNDKQVKIKGFKIHHHIDNVNFIKIGYVEPGIPIFFVYDSKEIIELLLNKKMDLSSLNMLDKMIIQRLNFEYSHIIDNTRRMVRDMNNNGEISSFSKKKLLNSLNYFI